MDISATEEIWNFVSKYNRQGLIDCEIVSLNETISDSKRKLIEVIDIFGRTVNFNSYNNQLLFYIYDDGSVQKKYISR